jgi:catechol 2,3-dioxygenase-like lactoylglutathione lyase family enzyme
MTAPPTFTAVAPIIAVRDLDAALARYALLGFATRRYGGAAPYGFAERDQVMLHISQVAGHDPATSDAALYLYVSDAASVHDEWRASGVDGRFHDVADTDYGLREFAYVDPDGTLHRVGSPTPR